MAVARVRPTPYPAHLNQFAVLPDPLSQITDQVRLSSLFCSLIRVSPPFARSATVESFNVLLMTHGQMYVEPMDEAEFGPRLLEAGDLLVFPRGAGYRMLYPLDVSRAVESTLAHVHDSSKPKPTEVEFLGLICYLDKVHRNLLTDFLPQVIHLKKRTPGLARWMKRTVESFQAEHLARSPGRSSVLSRLAEIVCVQALRIWIEQIPPDMKGWVQGLKDEQIATALQAIHKDPGRRWTVASLAQQAGMSRTMFATRFKSLVGESPMEYVSRWRMHHALELLVERRASLKAVVEATGYQSPTAFRRIFKRQFGILPSEYRRIGPPPESTPS
jgi:AraC-like DNA-binding protein